MDLQEFLSRIRHATGAHWLFLLALVLVSLVACWPAGVIQLLLIAAVTILDAPAYVESSTWGNP